MNKFITQVLPPRLRAAFSLERVICRIFAAWLCFSALFVLSQTTDFSELSFGQAMPLWQVAGFVALAFLLFSAAAAAVGDLFHADALFLTASAWGCVWQWLQQFDHDTDDYLFTLAVSVGMILLSVWAVKANEGLLSRLEPGPKVTAVLAIAVGVASCAVIAVIGVLRYKTFSSPNFDFGLFVNMFHNMKETGLPTVSSERDQILSHFAVHISPIFYVLLPFYWLFPTPETLQIGQAVALMAGAVAVFFLCRHFGLSRKVTLLVTALYAFYPALSAGTFYDLHENCFLPLCLLLTFLFYEKKKYIPMYLSAVGVLLVKEDAAIYLLVFAAFVLLSERKWLHGSILAAMSVGYFLLAVFLLETYGTGIMSGRFDNLIYGSDAGLGGAVKTAILNPGYLFSQLFTTKTGGWEKVAYFLQLVLPLGALPFCTKKASRWLLLSPMLINLLTRYVYQYDIGFQYHFAITAFLFYAMIKNLPELTLPTRRTLLTVAAAACCCLYIATVVPKCNTYTTRWSENQDTYREMEQVLDTIPEDASVACSTFLLAHFADRSEIYEVSYHKNKPDVDYVVLDARYSSHTAYRDAYLAHGYTVRSSGLIVVLEK